MSSFQKAKKSAAKLRLGIMGISGGGKTYTALQVATGIGGRIALIDTENASASKYADRFDFDTLQLTNHHPEEYAKAIRLAESEGYNVIIIDSMSQAWDATKKIAEKFAKEKRNGNTWAGWAEADPQYRKLVDAIIHSKAHIIGTMRAKTETAQEEVNGRKTVVKLGLGAEAGRGIEYEFDIMLEMEGSGHAKVGKTRFDKWAEKTFHKPGPELGKELAGWLSDGVPENVVSLPTLPSRQYQAALDEIRNAADLPTLKQLWEGSTALFAGQKEILGALASAKDTRKAELQAVAK